MFYVTMVVVIGRPSHCLLVIAACASTSLVNLAGLFYYEDALFVFHILIVFYSGTAQSDFLQRLLHLL